MKKFSFNFLLPFTFASFFYSPLANAAPTQFSSENFARTHFPFTGVKLPISNVENITEKNLIALYTDRGAWDLGVEHLKLFLNKYGYAYSEIKKEDILTGQLRSGRFSTLIMPGGASWEYLEDLGDKGAREILDFVAQGNSYLGICAGAFYATSHRKGGAATGAYGIGLLQGTAFDGTALQTPPFKEGMLDFEFSHPPLNSAYRIALLGGPSFQFDDEEARLKHIDVWARFEKINEAAMISFDYQKGKVFLSAPHPEVDEGLAHWSSSWFDPESDWPILDMALKSLRR